MAAVLIGNWWALALRGGAAVLFAIIALASPTFTATVLILVFGAYALIDGIFAFVAAQRAAHRHGRSWPLIVVGVFDIIVALVAFVLPGVALVVLVYVIALWALVTGVAMVTAGSPCYDSTATCWLSSAACCRLSWASPCCCIRVPAWSRSPGGSASMRCCLA